MFLFVLTDYFSLWPVDGRGRTRVVYRFACCVGTRVYAALPSRDRKGWMCFRKMGKRSERGSSWWSGFWAKGQEEAW